MFIGKSNEIAGRAFLQRSAQLAMMGAASSYALDLAGLAEAAAFSNAGGYKALVCVFLYGGNDHANTLIPFDAANYARYQAIRGTAGSEAANGIALARSSLANTVLTPPQGQTLTDNITYALAPTMPRLKALYDQGVMAPLLNVGPLIVPLTRAQYDAGVLPRPAKLFSHNDQQSTWQSSQPEGSPSGWGGRMADLALTSNTNSMFTAINATGNAVFLSGRTATPYQVAPSGATLYAPLQAGRLYNSTVAAQALSTLLKSGSGNVMAADYARFNDRSIQYGSFVNDALRTVTLSTPFPTGNRLADQMRVVAQLIGARARLGVTRQVFLVSLGGFDNHDGLIGTHDGLLGQVDAAMAAFYQATVELGVARNVTTFTASDFGRTLTSNGDGSDHGWGGHHFIVGGDVRGGRFYGTAPQVSTTGPDQVGQGRLLPTVAVDQLSSTLGLWFGVAPSELPSIAPNIGRFASSDLGFMRPAQTAVAATR
ncbi:MAG: DUF1501 domain-containing protein [Erythrobacter sp.]